LINERKPFVVSSEYIGPDRRRDPSRGDTDIPQCVPSAPMEQTKLIA
jgi:hypothetical protein